VSAFEDARAGGVVDTLVGLPPGPGDTSWRDDLRPLLKDAESLGGFEHPASYMFKNLPDARFADDPPRAVLEAMDRFGVERAFIGVSAENVTALRAIAEHPDRFVPTTNIDPSSGMDGVRVLRRAVEDFGVKAAGALPVGTIPQRAVDEPQWFPLYAACIDLGVPFCPCMGVPGPRVPFAPQHVMGLDRVCYEFPELVIVTRHGCEPWEELMVKLMLKWPNLHYSTSAFAPKYYPKAIVDYANTRGADRVIFAGYFPMGLSYDTIFEQLPGVPFRDRIWPKFLRENAVRVFGL
jgi:predicted TIM-barrel fold metal-dependent hydrolase